MQIIIPIHVFAHRKVFEKIERTINSPSGTVYTQCEQENEGINSFESKSWIKAGQRSADLPWQDTE